MRVKYAVIGLLALAGLAGVAACSTAPSATDPSVVARGRYLVTIGGCNDCHTPHYPERAGKVPESEWLIGDRLGWRGPWGTSYATNLRLFFAAMDERQWIEYARRMEPRPPMPWFNLRAMTDADLAAIFHYTRSLTPVGEPAPAALPPGATPPGPYVQFPSP